MEEKVKEIAECCICTDLFTDPRILPCIHTFCLKCLKETSVKARLKPGDAMPCPICRTLFIIPSEGMVGLKSNFFMKRLVEVTKISKPSNQPQPCEVCLEESKAEATDVPVAAQYCIQCQKNICDRCCRDHGRFQELKVHQLVLLGSPMKEGLIKKFTVQFCDLHKKKEVDMFCLSCKKVICAMCFALMHKSHECSDIDGEAEKFHQEITTNTKQMDGFLKETSRKLQNIVEELKGFQHRVSCTEKAIIGRGNELKEIVDKCTRVLLTELAAVKQKGMKSLKTEEDEIKRHHVTVESLKLYYQELLSKGSSAEICRVANDLNCRSDDLKKSHNHLIQQQISPIQVTFEASKLEDFLKTSSIVGIIKQENGAKEINEAVTKYGKKMNTQIESGEKQRMKMKTYVIFGIPSDNSSRDRVKQLIHDLGCKDDVTIEEDGVAHLAVPENWVTLTAVRERLSNCGGCRLQVMPEVAHKVSVVVDISDEWHKALDDHDIKLEEILHQTDISISSDRRRMHGSSDQVNSAVKLIESCVGNALIKANASYNGHSSIDDRKLEEKELSKEQTKLNGKDQNMRRQRPEEEEKEEEDVSLEVDNRVKYHSDYSMTNGRRKSRRPRLNYETKERNSAKDKNGELHDTRPPSSLYSRSTYSYFPHKY